MGRVRRTPDVPRSTVTAADDLIVGLGDSAVTRLAVAASRLIGKKASGAIAALTAAETVTVLGAALTDLLPWRFDIDPYMTPLAKVGSWSPGVVTSDLYNGSLDSDNIQNDSIDFVVTLAAGTWQFELMHVQSTNRGIYKVQIDNGAGTFTDLGTIDGYAAVTTRNVRTAVTGIVLASTIKRTLRLLMDTKNASSSGYTGSLQNIALRRTA